MKILILGSTGMLGSALLFELSRNNKVQIFATYRDEKIKYLLEKKNSK